MGKQMEGDNAQRRAAAAEARSAGRSASEVGATTGASGQIRHLGNEASHEEKVAGPGLGKAQPDRVTADPANHSLPTERLQPEAPDDALPPRSEMEATEPGQLGEDDQRVFETVARLEDGDTSPTAGDVSRSADIDIDLTTAALQRLMDVHDVVQEVRTDDGAPPTYQVKARV